MTCHHGRRCNAPSEKHQATQRYHLVRADSNLATIQLSTQLKAEPTNVADRIPLLQRQPEGEIAFNLGESGASGQGRGVKLQPQRMMTRARKKSCIRRPSRYH